jgi:hypothetical protein
MKFSLNEILAMNEGLNTVLAKELPVKPAYWLARFLDKVSSEYKVMEDTRTKLVVKYAKKDKDGNPMMKKDKTGEQKEYDLTKINMEKFQAEYAELGKEEFEVDFEPIKYDQLGDIKLKPMVLIQLKKIIVE